MHTTSLSFLSILGLIFITLKLVGTITWSWIWVLIPFWIVPVTWIVVLIVLFIAMVIIEILKDN